MVSVLNNLIYLGVLLIIFSFPLYLVRFSVFSIPTTFVEVLIYFVFFLWCISLFFKEKRKTILKTAKEILSSEKILVFGLLLLFFGALVSSFYSENLRVSFGLFKAYFFDAFLFLLLFVFNIKNKRMLKAVLVVFAASGFFVALASFFYFVFGKLTYDGRLQGIFNSPNFLAMSLAPVLLVWFSLLREAQRKYLFVLVFFYSFLLSVFFLTDSFGAFFALAFVFLLALIFSKISFSRKVLFLLFVAVLSFSFLFAEKDAILEFFEDDRSSFASRVMIWKASYEILKDNYILGIGPGMFQKYYLDYQSKFKTPYLEWAVPYPHNIFLAFWIQTGILGFLGFLVLIFWSFRSVFLLAKNNTDKKIAFLAGGFFVYFLIHGLVDTPFWKNDLSLVFFFFLGILIVLKIFTTQACTKIR